MFVESIKLFGFKSFAGKAEITLNGGITGIIGPNGCGKSNIADALRWVLGEQSTRMLRGASMEDVIFKGSRERKPLGMAEVMLRIRNDEGLLPIEYTELGIGRRLYRSGVSEYLLNKTPCRLKDIRSLFLDSGLGVSAYAIFERQMIDDILNENSPRRREMFEEASGIMKYKVRKKEALRKLESSTRDLERLSDLITEIGREVRSLSRQVGRARRYRRLKETIRDLDVAVSATRLGEIMRRRTAVERELEEANGRVTGFAAELRTGEMAIETLRTDLLRLGEALAEARRELAERKDAVASQQQRSEVLAERRAGLERSIAELTEEAKGEDTQAGRLEKELAACGEEVAALQAAADEKEADLRRAEAVLGDCEVDLEALRGRLASLQQITMNLRETESHKRHELAREHARQEELTHRRERLESDRRDAEAHVEVLERRIDDRGDELREREEALSRLRRDLDEHETERRQILADIERLGERRGEIETDRAALASRVETLEELQRTYEGFDHGARALLIERPEGVLGAIAELIHVDPAESAAVEAALGSAMESVVVRDVATALRCIEGLARAEKGRVMFCPLREMAGRALPRPDVPGRCLADLIRAREEVRPAVEMLLGRAFLAEEAARAASLSREHPDLTWVTRTGEAFHQDRRVSGGRGGGAGRRIFEREAEIASLRGQLAAQDAQGEAVHAERTRLRSRLEAIERRAEEIREAVREAEGLVAESANAVSHLELERNLTRDEARGLAAELAKLGEEHEAIRSRIRSWETACEEAETAGEQHAGEWERQTAALRTQEGRREEAVQQVGDLRVAFTRASAESASAATRLERLQTDREEAARAAEDKRRRILQAQTQIAAIAEELSTLSGLLGGADGRIAEASRRVDGLTGEEAELRSTWGERDKALRALRDRLSEARETAHRCDLELSSLSGETSRIRDRLFEDYRVVLQDKTDGRGIPLVVRHERKHKVPSAQEPPDAALGEAAELSETGETGEDAPEVPTVLEEVIVTEPMPAEPPKRYAGMPVEAWREKLSELRDALERFGPVNEMAVEEYDAKKTRLDFLTSQHTDLVEARDGLIETIRKVNREARERFQRTFAQVQENFKRVFETLFPGGEAEIRLEGNDPLEDDILMVARPHGKRVESIKLLSSGERALTATALLFAIYLVKPAPFCILDEVDAPLDDANIDRYVTLLRKFSERTQFVLITHNKKTMEACDTLYGVTMEEAGVSKLVSVKFIGGDLVVDGVTSNDLPAS